MQVESSDHRPATPDSPLASSLYHATTTIDDLTLALTNFSRVPSPEPQTQICCCCGAEECEATKSWLALRSKLESRLVLSAEVGSALLQRHEAYVRRHEQDVPALLKTTQDREDDVDARLVGLLKENAALDKRLTQALLNNEVAETSNKDLLHNLEEARSAVSRLSAHHMRTVGLDTRLSAVLQDNDDIRQERDSQTQRAKLAEARLVALKDRTDKLQAELRRLQDDLEVGRLHRLESSSESLLRDVRSRLEGFQTCHAAKSVADEEEVIKIIESLVADNEMLKTDNKEIYKLLTESREDLQALQREVGEQSIVPPIRVETPSKHSWTSSGTSSFAKDSLFGSTRRQSSVESRSRRTYEPLTPETGRRPLSPAEPLLVSATSFVHPRPRYPPSQLSISVDNEPEIDQGLLHPYQVTKAVQTDRWLGLYGIGNVSPSFMDHPSIFPFDGHSDSSSPLDCIGSPMSSLLERMHSLVHRMTHADALTLTNRLKRQHLRGADVKHLSRTTVSNILSDVSQLRAQYRVWLEDDKMTTSCTRKDLRRLFRLFREVLEEMGQMRVTLNDVILEPTVADRVSEMAMDPTKEAMEKERKIIGVGPGASWMTPFSKIFGSSVQDAHLLTSATRASPQLANRNHGNDRVSRPVLKTGPALAASSTTVNVEFSGTGAGKSVTSVFSAHPNSEATGSRPPLPNLSARIPTNHRNLMDIFAGAPHSDDASDPWVVLPRAPRCVQSVCLAAEPTEGGTATIGRSVRRRKPSQFSRDVDAILVAPLVSSRNIEDSEVDDTPGPLFGRPLRRRGLSDSSIRSTLINQGGSMSNINVDPVESAGSRLERGSVLRTLGRTMQNFKQAASHTISGVSHTSDALPQTLTPDPTPAPSVPYLPVSTDGLNISRFQPHRVPSRTFTSFLPSLTSLVAAGVTVDSTHPRSLHGGHREDTGIPRLFGRDGQGREI